MRRFLESNIGACEDHAFLLQVLYDGNAMPSRMCSLPVTSSTRSWRAGA